MNIPIKTFEYDHPQDGAACTAHAWAKVPATPTAEEKQELELQNLEEPKSLSSSMLSEVQWSSNEELTATFQSGSVETYPKVSRQAFEELLKSSSPGSWMWSNILRSVRHY